MASTANASNPAHTSATRHEEASVIGTNIVGASAQPRLPVMPCTLKAWPSRDGCTLRLSKV